MLQWTLGVNRYIKNCGHMLQWEQGVRLSNLERRDDLFTLLAMIVHMLQ